MEFLQTQKKLFFALLLCFSSVQFISSDYSPIDKYFINCGSTDNATVDTRFFIPDSKNSSSVNLSATPNLFLTDPSPSQNSSAIYHTARLFTSQSSYEFNIQSDGTHLVRLHFFPFTSENHDLRSAVFNVSALRFLLLKDFRVLNKTQVIKEYLIWVDRGKLSIMFTPWGNSSLAFVNAIEVFSAPDDLLTRSPLVLSETALETVYRINMAGPEITPLNDTVWRTWIPDDKFLHFNRSTVPVLYPGQIKYLNGHISREIAPDKVYNSARRRYYIPYTDNQFFNMTWAFNVSRGYKYLVRMHFCDFNSSSPTYMDFNVFINDGFAYQNLRPASFTNGALSVPFYMDFVAKPDELGVMKIKLGSPSDSSNPFDVTNATLNGLEIMKMNNSMGALDGEFDSNSHGPKSKKPHIIALIVSILGSLALVILLIFIVLMVFKRRKPLKKLENTESEWSPMALDAGNSYSLGSKLTENLGLQISFADIISATNNFDENSLVGSGGFGRVYKGILADGRKVAVKRGATGASQGPLEFHNEIIILSQIRHRHLVPLIGYCTEGSEMILVYEFMENGPLREHLYGSDRPCLSWKQRLEICISSASGLHYLHTAASLGIIHRDVKSSNILLDEHHSAKVSDFGLSKLGPHMGQTHVSTTIKGSFGYLDPEYIKSHHLTQKSDVYSFGVVLLEVLCARSALDTSLPVEQVNLAEWAMHCKQRGMLECIVDPRIAGNINTNSLRKFEEVAEKCLAEYGVDRPTMGDVMWDLKYALRLQETEMQREPFEDSSNNATGISLISVRRTPSSSVQMEGDSHSEMSDNSSKLTTSQVFSQLITNDGR